MRLLLSGGGTGGHIYPALAIAEEMKRVVPDIEILYIGTKDGREADLVPRTGIPFETVHVMGMPRKLSPALIPFGFALLGALRESNAIINRFQPDLAIGTGGFVSGPVLYRAARKGIYTLIHEQNSYPGIANRILSRYVDDIAVTFDESVPYFNERSHTTKTGNPIRSVFFTLEKNDALYEKYELDPNQKTVFIFGGSNGHDTLNESVGDMKERFQLTDHQLVLVTGPDHYDAFLAAYGPLPDNIKIFPYLFDIHEMYALADLMVTSSGAITLAEIQASGLASILIPKAYTTENHQTKNALATQDKGAAVVIEEKDLSGNALFERIQLLLSDENKLQSMKKSSAELGTPDAAKEIASLALEGYRNKTGKNKK